MEVGQEEGLVSRPSPAKTGDKIQAKQKSGSYVREPMEKKEAIRL